VDSRTEEVIKHLNRLVNDRAIPPRARKRISDAVQHIHELELKVVKIKGAAVQHLRKLKLKLAKLNGD